ncbi:hypothetical protein TNCV_3246591 [Trichonephila clavipes]|nr:hypothetical protein TNCV_3246591 [Trichonephila clavipes]
MECVCTRSRTEDLSCKQSMFLQIAPSIRRGVLPICENKFPLKKLRILTQCFDLLQQLKVQSQPRQEESDPVDDETDEDEDNNKNSKSPSNPDELSALETAMEWYEQQSECCSTQLLLLKRIRDVAAKKWCTMVQRKFEIPIPPILSSQNYYHVIIKRLHCCPASLSWGKLPTRTIQPTSRIGTLTSTFAGLKEDTCTKDSLAADQRRKSSRFCHGLECRLLY